jgi:carbonic anhydrase
MAKLKTSMTCNSHTLMTKDNYPRLLGWQGLGPRALLTFIAILPLILSAAEMDHAAEAQPLSPTAKRLNEQVREATDGKSLVNKRLTLVVNGKEKKFITIPAPVEAQATEDAPPQATKKTVTEKSLPLNAATAPASHVKRNTSVVAMPAHRQVPPVKAPRLSPIETPTQAHHPTPGHWSYEGETGPQAWGSLKKEFTVCAIGKRQSPINIEETATLQGPAEPLQFKYQASSGTVVNNGHTIQVDLTGDNAVTVRGSSYKLLQFHFHTPSEERVNGQGFAMVAHLVHKNAENQLAVVAVLLEPGVANSLIHQVWTYMPLDSGDRVSMPTGLIDMNALLPKDPRYYQFMGSLTTPPCTEGVLWMVMKQATTMSKEQIKLFTQIFPHNARPVQALNGRSVRDAQ